MSYIPTPEQALEIVKKYNKDEFHVHHAKTVSAVMGSFAEQYDPDNKELWKSVGMLHDEDVDENIIHAVISHGYGICSDVKPIKTMEKVLFAVDELTGLIGAAALMRPNGISDMEAKSVMKKFKDKKFAAGCSRDVISKGAEMLEMDLKELMEKTIAAMRENPIE